MVSSLFVCAQAAGSAAAAAVSNSEFADGILWFSVTSEGQGRDAEAGNCMMRKTRGCVELEMKE